MDETTENKRHGSKTEKRNRCVYLLPKENYVGSCHAPGERMKQGKQTVDKFNKRMTDHRYKGRDTTDVTILETLVGTEADAQKAEQRWINDLKPTGNTLSSYGLKPGVRGGKKRKYF
tara:strand:- start:5 stop:355 length:351 start_codon:yes stop_codon:yes gene_type:complete